MLDAICDQVVFVYSRMGLVIVLYVDAIVSFDFPHCVHVRAFRRFIDFFAFSVVTLMCSEKFSFGSSVRPRIFG